MIHNKSRAGWVGASDTATVMGNWETKTFADWWNIKLGITEGNFSNQYTAAGTAYEHRILDFLGIKGRDRQIRIRRIGKYRVRLRVNLDGEDDIIHEVKTHKSETFTVSKAYWMQAQVEAFASRKRVVIDAYRLLPADYDNFFNPIDEGRLSRHPVAYDGGWVEREYLPRLVYLSRCMKEGRFPCKAEYTHTLSYIMSGQSDYTVIEEKTTKSQCAWTIPESAYELIPNSRYVYITIKCETFNGNTSKGVRYAYIIGTTREDLCKPEVTATAEDVNEAAVSLTGDAQKIVKGISALRVISAATAKNSASVKSVAVSAGGKTASGTDVTIEGAESASVSVVVTDTREYSSTYTITDLSLIEYIPLTLNPTIQRESPGSDAVNIEISGNYFNGSFGATDNTLSVKARVRILNGEYGDPIDLAVTVSGNSYTARGALELSYSNIYEVEITASDAVSTRTVTERAKKGVPVFHWGEDYFRFRVPAVIQSESPLAVDGVGRTDSEINNEIRAYAESMSEGYFKFIYNPTVNHSILGSSSLLIECFKVGDVKPFSIWLKVSSASQFPYVKIYVANYQSNYGWSGWQSVNGNSTAVLPTVTEEDNGKVLTVADGTWVASELPKYEGEYSITPQVNEQTLLTAQKYMDADVKIEKIPYSEVSNNSGGKTATIGG